MEESWQFKCSSTMQSSAPSVPSSSSSLELRNQVGPTSMAVLSFVLLIFRECF